MTLKLAFVFSYKHKFYAEEEAMETARRRGRSTTITIELQGHQHERGRQQRAASTSKTTASCTHVIGFHFSRMLAYLRGIVGTLEVCIEEYLKEIEVTLVDCGCVRQQGPTHVQQGGGRRGRRRQSLIQSMSRRAITAESGATLQARVTTTRRR